MFHFLLILSALLSLLAFAVLAARLCSVERLRLGSKEVSLSKNMNLSGDVFTAKDGLTAAAWGLGVLLLTHLAAMLYCGIFLDGISWENFNAAWKHYDAFHYLGLAEHGYAGYTEDGRPLFLVFFPLYPWLMRLLHLLIPSYALCGYLLSGLCYIGSCYMLARLATEEFGRAAGRLSLAFLSAYPFSFFFSAVFTESLFLLLSLLSFYFIRKHRYSLAGLFGAFSALTRMQGAFLAVIAFAEYCITEHPLRKIKDRSRPSLWKDLWGKLFWMAFVGTGTLSYLLLNFSVTGDPFRFMLYQKERWNQGFSLFTESLQKLWNGILYPTPGYEFAAFTTWGPELVLFAFCLIFLLYGVRRLPPVWTLYYGICLFLNYSLNNPLSCGRYMACAFPLPALLALVSRRRPMAGRFLLLCFGLLHGVFLVAYFAGKHIC